MSDPYFKINPIKIEIIKQSPAHVVLYHSVLSENEVEKIESYNIEVSKAIIKTFTLPDCLITVPFDNRVL